MLAARGRRDMGDGEEPITDQEELRQIRKKAMGIHMKSIAAALVFAGLMVVAGRI
jgi:hypothetical protein